ncbi:MAG: ATP-binding cassette domain-containing protein [Salinibacter sp.]|jgi:ABC-type multidrug transport system, ATPase component|uniref:ABC transporter ATP-binding protein n=1 Tax=Salinibacter sp. TaxID=2065818 RepID=UPI002FC2997A
MPTLTADHVGHYFGRLLLFRELSLTLHAGETLAVTGANGAGKSTLLRILAGLLTPRTGTATLAVDGDSVPADEHPLRTGLVAPAVGVYEELTARETLRFLARARRVAAPATRINEVLARVGLVGRADDRVETYSSGMRQRVKYAAALLSLPPLLLLDEPVANLDAAGRKMVASITESWRTQGRLLVVATNRPDEAERHDRRLRIEDHR